MYKIDEEDRNLFKGTPCLAATGYYVVWHNGKLVLLHRLIMNFPEGKQVDHINGDRTDNRRSNLRVVTNQQNQMNRKATSNTGIKGVYLRKDTGSYSAKIKINGKSRYLGNFRTLDEAAECRLRAEIELFGDYRRK